MPRTKYYPKSVKPTDKAQEEIESLKDDDFILPQFSGYMEHTNEESLMFFSYAKHNKRSYRLFYGIGVVYRVVKGEKIDMVYINFGIFKSIKTRVVVTYDNHARRQLMTLKRGQVCQVYGLCRYYKTDCEINGEKKKGIRLGLYAKAILGWYVPTMLDIKKMPINEDLVNATEGEKKLEETFEEVLDSFLND